MATFKNKKINVLIITVLIVLAVAFAYSTSSRLLKIARAHLYVYGYSLPKNLEVEDTSKLHSAEAVPILMYHGVIVNGNVNENTSRENFISQMEILKQKGYETISVKEYDLFREGKFKLPGKPIIITFDDGRKDSFYPVDEILEKLGFKATLFVATIKANENYQPYLSWDELKEVQVAGRWEIEAHGRRSHEEVTIDGDEAFGRYYASRIYMREKGLESIEDYKKRVERDYVDGIADIKEHLGIDAHYFAVPLNDYGAFQESNYDGAYEFNQELTRRFFKLAFVQVQQRDGVVFESFYNYRDSNPAIGLKRLEVKNMSADDLLKSLERFSPKTPNLAFPSAEGNEEFLKNTYLLYGTVNVGSVIELLSHKSKSSARMLFGDAGWKNYGIEAEVVREKGRSVSVIIYYNDEDNFISLNWGEKSLSLIERLEGKERELASYYPWEKDGRGEFFISVYNGVVRAYFSEAPLAGGIVLTGGISVKLSRGAAGFSVWGPNGARSTIRNLKIESLTSAPLSPVISIAKSAPNGSIGFSTSSAMEASDVSKTEIGNKAVETAPVAEKILPYIFSGLNKNEWEKSWGDFSITDGALNIGAGVSGKGGGALLKGSSLWKDYFLKTKIDWLKSETFSLISRYRDSDNYVVCSFSDYGGKVSLSKFIEGEATTLAENYFLQIPYYTPWLNINLGMKVKDNHIECLINDEWVLRYDVEALPQAGGIGFETWDPEDPRNIQIQIKDVSVLPL